MKKNELLGIALLIIISALSVSLFINLTNGVFNNLSSIEKLNILPEPKEYTNLKISYYNLAATFAALIIGFSGLVANLAIWLRQLEYNRQKDNEQSISDVEKRFFNLLDGFRTIQMETQYFNQTGAKAFAFLRKELNTHIFYARELKDELMKNNIDIIDFAFTCYYFGLKNEDSLQLIDERYGKKITDTIHLYKRSLEAAMHNPLDERELLIRGEEKQQQLGHYLRRIYLVVDFISNQEKISFDAKYEMLKILRTSLSTDEQIIILFNSLSAMGKDWRERKDNHPFSYMELYNISKNIPSKKISDFDILDYYPDLDLEVSPLTSYHKKIKHLKIASFYKKKLNRA